MTVLERSKTISLVKAIQHDATKTTYEVVELLMTAYMSAEQEKSLDFRPAGLESFIPAVARGTWKA